MKKVTIVHGPQGCGKTSHAAGIMYHLKADASYDCGALLATDHAARIGQMFKDSGRKVHDGYHVVVLCQSTDFPKLNRRLENWFSAHGIDCHVCHGEFAFVMQEIGRNALLAQDYTKLEERVLANLTPEQVEAMTKAARQYPGKVIEQMTTLHIEPGSGKTTEELVNAIRNRSVTGRTRHQHPTINNARSEFLGKEAKRAFPAPANHDYPEKRARIRGVLNGATMYAMGMAEAFAAANKHVTFIVNNDDECKALLEEYPFVNWDSGRIAVRTVSEILMVNALEEGSALGRCEWICDLNAPNLSAVMELDAWNVLTAVMSMSHFEMFTRRYGK